MKILSPNSYLLNSLLWATILTALVTCNGCERSQPASAPPSAQDASAHAPIDPAQAWKNWTVRTGGPISGAAAVVDGIAYAGSFANRIVGVDARTGRVRVWFGHGEYAAVSGNGMQLLFHGYSTLYAVQSRPAPHAG